jgi:hypothetical protein
MGHMKSTVDLHRRVRKENHKVYLNLSNANVEPFDFYRFDVERGIFYKQGDFYGNHYKYHCVSIYSIRPNEPLEWKLNAVSSGQIPILSFNKNDCDFGKDPTIVAAFKKNQLDKDEENKDWILNHPKL